MVKADFSPAPHLAIAVLGLNVDLKKKKNNLQ